MRIHFLLLWLLVAIQLAGQTTPDLPKPSPAQLRWHETEFYLFFHFGPNTFTNLEWGHGTETEDVFNPTDLDCDQWCRVAKQAGARGVVITAKHHDGFCLWPSGYSTHTVRESPWKDGRGDVLRELSEACRRHGLKFGVYLSPWDRNHPQYGTPEYNDVYAKTLTELLTGYGELFEVWWDGANGEGPNGKKQVYDFHRFEKLVARLQPDAVIFSDIGPGCRWAGNERGTVNETNWCTLDTAGFGRGATGPPADTLQRGNSYGANWIPAECDVSIRPGWFYHPEEDEQVKTPEQLLEIYLKSVGRGANLILNVPPDRRGRIHARDSLHLAEFGALLHTRFSSNLAKDKKWIRLFRACAFTPRKYRSDLNDGDPATYQPLHQDVAVSGPVYREVLDLGRKRRFQTIVLQEYLPEGQRIAAFTVEVREKGEWQMLFQGTTIGHKRILTFPEVRARRIRFTVKEARAHPLISEVAVY
ncbi:MAG: glycoside hydrolase family 29 (alpha-L-fucosidase) [Bacteroidetes bacterium]|nr:MAG: glycoside hydrolase family 29 (alpha-L-fucosidase) [Bacteroidota bacterium]